jgi:anti-sigma-K factor RskA
MNYLRPELLDRLAREYALGTLQGPARRRFEAIRRRAPLAAMAVTRWQQRLGHLANSVPQLQPSAAVWQQLEQRLFAAGRAQAAQAPGPKSALQALWGWLGVAARPLGGALAGVLLCVLVLRNQPELIGLQAPTDTFAPSYVGVLTDAQQQPVLLAGSLRHGRQLTLRLLRPLGVPQGKVAQLWALPTNGAPMPLAVVGDVPGKSQVSLPATSEVLFAQVPRLGVSFEDRPLAAGDKPSGEFVISGNCVKLW